MIVTARAPVTAAAFVPVEQIGGVLPDVALIDQNGRGVSLRNALRPTIVSFAYTRCPDPAMCSAVTAKFAALQRSLAGTGIRLVEISLDPAYDRPAVLHAYAAAVGARADHWSFATGRANDVHALAQRFGIVFEPTTTNVSGHSELVAIVASDGTLIDRIDGTGWSPGDLDAQSRADAGFASNPLQRLALRLFASASAFCGRRGAGITVLAAIALFVALTTVIGAVTFGLSMPVRLERPRL